MLDLHLPVMGGFEVMNTLGQRGSRLPVIVITGRGDAETKARALQAGARAFLEKPLDHRSLMAAIQTALEAETQPRRATTVSRQAIAQRQAPIPTSPRRLRSPGGRAPAGCAPPSFP